MTEQMQQGLKAARDLQGLDRTQPLGLAVFLPDTLPPRPTVVALRPATRYHRAASGSRAFQTAA